MTSSRRSFLRVVGVGASLLAGCTGEESEPLASTTTQSTTTRDGTRTTATSRPTTTGQSSTTSQPTTELPERISWAYTIGDDIQYDIGTDGQDIYVPSSDLYALSPGGEKRWVFETTDTVNSDVVVADALYFAHSGVVQAVEFDGTERWRLPWEYEGAPYLLAVTDEHVYASGVNPVGRREGHRLVAIEADTGTVEWTAEVSSRAEAVVSGNTIFVVGPGIAQAFSTEDGSELWAARYDGNLAGLAGISQGVLTVYGDALYGLSTDDGAVEWTLGGDTEQTGLGVVNAVVQGDRTFVATDRDFRVVSQTNGQTRWRISEFSGTPRIEAFDGDIAILAFWNTSGADALASVALTERSVEWTWSDGQTIHDTYPHDSGILVKGETTLRSLNLVGREKWRFDFGVSINSPVVTDESIYVGTRTMDQTIADARTVPGTVYAIKE